MKDLYVAITKYCHRNFPLHPDFLKDVVYLSPFVREQNWTVNSIGRLAALLLHIVSEQEITIVKDQWRLYQAETIDENWIKDSETGKLKRLDQYWAKILKIVSLSDGSRKYNILSKVFKTCLSVPNGNAGAERILSHNKNMPLSERTNLKPKTIVGMRRAKEYARTFGSAHNVNTYDRGKT